MSRPEATYRTLEGDVELRLLNGRVVHTPALSIREAKELLALLEGAAAAVRAIGADEEPRRADIDAFMEVVNDFPKRTGLLDERVIDLGFELEGPDGELVDLGALRLHDALAMARLYGVSIADPFAIEGSQAKVRVLDEFPAAFGLDPDAHEPATVYEMARAFTEELYELIYGLARDFSGTLTASPPVRVLELRAPTETENLPPGISVAGSAG